jgi:hypothetical protein
MRDLHAVLLSPKVKSDEVMRLWEARFLLKTLNLVYIEEGDFIAMKKFTIFIALACVVMISPMAFAQNWQPAGDNWIAKWWGLDLVTSTGGFNTSAGIDYLAEGSGGLISNASVSTRDGAGKTANAVVNLPDNGGALAWSIVDINVSDQLNMSTSHGLPDGRDITWHGLIVVISPDERTTTMHPAHDDYAQIWINGEQVYDNSAWTGGVQEVTTPTEIQFKKGENFLHFKCGESGGADYVNLHFEPTDTDLLIAPTTDNLFLDVLTPVEPQGKLATQWADLKRK